MNFIFLSSIILDPSSHIHYVIYGSDFSIQVFPEEFLRYVFHFNAASFKLVNLHQFYFKDTKTFTKYAQF